MPKLKITEQEIISRLESSCSSLNVPPPPPPRQHPRDQYCPTNTTRFRHTDQRFKLGDISSRKQRIGRQHFTQQVRRDRITHARVVSQKPVDHRGDVAGINRPGVTEVAVDPTQTAAQ